MFYPDNEGVVFPTVAVILLGGLGGGAVLSIALDELPANTSTQVAGHGDGHPFYEA